MFSISKLLQTEMAKRIWGAFLLIGLTFLAYGPSLKNGFIWDDSAMLTENVLVKADAQGLRRIWFSTEPVDYFPMTLSSLWVEWRLWGMNPTGYHVANVLLHALSAVIIWRVLRRLQIPGAWWAAAIFAVHPVNVESVAWIAERKNTLSLFFFVLSIWFFLKQGDVQNNKKATGESLTHASLCWYGFSLAAFLLALLSKTAVVTLPFVLLGMAWWQRGKIVKRDVIRSLPFFGLSLVLGLATIWFQYNRAISIDVVNTNTFAQRLAGAGWAVWFYLSKALFPANLMAIYPRWDLNTHQVLTYLPDAAVVGALVLFWVYRKGWGRPFLFAFGYFVVTLFPVLGFLNIYFQRFAPVADHWQYMPMLGVVALAAGVVTHIAQRHAMTALLPLTVCLGTLTWNQTKIYKNEETLWRDTVQKNPTSFMARSNLGALLLEQGRIKEAEEQLRASIPVESNAGEVLDYQNSGATPPNASGAFTRGLTLVANDRVEEALLAFKEAIRLKPNWPAAMNEAAWILATHPRPEIRNAQEAVRLASRACELDGYKDALYLGTLDAAYADAGQFKEAIATAEKAHDQFLKEGKMELAQEALKRIQLYEAGKAFHQP